VESGATGGTLGALAESLGTGSAEGAADTGVALSAAEAVGSAEAVTLGDWVGGSGVAEGALVTRGLGKELAASVGAGLAGGDAPGATVTQPVTVKMMGTAASASLEWRISLPLGRPGRPCLSILVAGSVSATWFLGDRRMT